MIKPIQYQFHQDQLPRLKEPKQNKHIQNQLPQATKNKYKPMQKTTTFPKAGLIKSVQTLIVLKDILQTVAWKIKYNTPAVRSIQFSRRQANQAPVNNMKTKKKQKKKKTLIIGGIVLGLTALIIYEIY